MIYIKDNPRGIDKQIQKMQNLLYERLQWGDIEIYGRVYRNPSTNQNATLIKPEAYVGDKEYKDVLLNDLKNATIFFVDGNYHKKIDNRYFSTELKVIVFVNLANSLPDIEHRADMEAEIQVIRLLNRFGFFKQRNIEKSVDVIFKGFDTSKIKLSDMHPYHVFALQGVLEYDIDDC